MAGRKPTISDEEILAVFLNTDDPVLTTSEVRDAIGFSTNDGTLKRLNKLELQGYLADKQPGKARLWWLTPDGEEYIRSQSHRDIG